ncbi:hypothetical protein FHR81_003978 [Actinoalloteichus hoggarensis]|uniref:Uncharacterized protein n=1 Tax=Actinoalloteichus hoggarensis TaxID=1470176 RepID=A0A221VWB3_9PSEU|nr:endonuclease [Actinoalloteichus hoggarensis]ASO17794.1 hypothetical protein AHOG_00605 [Actinoalloteichus hoggarensis]MBB5922921.1 hypothetical protein [Actinoalloteichus hoggarensis]
MARKQETGRGSRRAARDDRAAHEIADRLLAEAGTTYAEEAGIRIADKPAALYRLLMLAELVSVPIRANTAVAAAREIADSGMGTPRAVRESSRHDLIHALGRAHYVRYDESTATALHRGAELMRRRYHDDLRRLRKDAERDPTRMPELIREFPRLGPVGADVFCREAQAVWPELRPYFDAKAQAGARRLGLPTEPERLAELVDPDDYARLAAALVRATLERDLASRVTEQV